MKIAVLLSRIEQTGVTTHTLDLCQGMVGKGHSIRLITGGRIEEAMDRVNDFYRAFQDLGVEIVEFKTPRGNPLQKAYESVTSVWSIMKAIRRFDPDVIHCQSPYMTFIPWLMRKKFTTTIHILYLKKNLKYKNPDHMIAISRESYEFGKRVFGMREEDISLIHHGVSDRFAKSISKDEKARLRQRLHIAPDKIILGYVGSISLRKVTDLLIRALQDLPDREKNQMHFVFLGGVSGSKDYQWLQDLIRNAHIEQYISVVPFEDPKPFYDIFDIFILPSRMESFPLVTLEAMMSECCPIRSNTEGAYEQITDGETGLLFPTEQAGELTKAMIRVINDGTLRKTLAGNAKNRALEEFTIPVMTEKTLKVYEKIRMPVRDHV